MILISSTTDLPNH